MTPAITTGLILSVLTLGAGGVGAWTTLNNNVTENHTLIIANDRADSERKNDIKEDLKELKENDKEIQRLLRRILGEQGDGG